MSIPKPIRDRVSWAIAFAWHITVDKIVNGEIRVNKEASLQMQYSSTLKTVLDLIRFSPSDRIEIELETTVSIECKPYIIDILLTYTDGLISEKHSIELKCYKTISSSGGKRGASDIFMHSVYLDIYYSELYMQHKFADHTTCLILTDYVNFVHPKHKKTKNWQYDISQGHSINGGHYTTSIGGKNVDFNLTNAYRFNWLRNGSYWTALVQPIDDELPLTDVVSSHYEKVK